MWWVWLATAHQGTCEPVPCMGKKCNKCNVVGHFSYVCRRQANENSAPPQRSDHLQRRKESQWQYSRVTVHRIKIRNIHMQQQDREAPTVNSEVSCTTDPDYPSIHLMVSPKVETTPIDPCSGNYEYQNIILIVYMLKQPQPTTVSWLLLVPLW